MPAGSGWQGWSTPVRPRASGRSGSACRYIGGSSRRSGRIRRTWCCSSRRRRHTGPWPRGAGRGRARRDREAARAHARRRRRRSRPPRGGTGGSRWWPRTTASAASRARSASSCGAATSVGCARSGAIAAATCARPGCLRETGAAACLTLTSWTWPCTTSIWCGRSPDRRSSRSTAAAGRSRTARSDTTRPCRRCSRSRTAPPSPTTVRGRRRSGAKRPGTATGSSSALGAGRRGPGECRRALRGTVAFEPFGQPPQRVSLPVLPALDRLGVLEEARRAIHAGDEPECSSAENLRTLAAVLAMRGRPKSGGPSGVEEIRGVTDAGRARRRHDRREGGRDLAGGRGARDRRGGVPALDAAPRAGRSRIPRTGGAPRRRCSRGCRSARSGSASPARCTGSSPRRGGPGAAAGDPLERPAHGRRVRRDRGADRPRAADRADRQPRADRVHGAEAALAPPARAGGLRAHRATCCCPRTTCSCASRASTPSTSADASGTLCSTSRGGAGRTRSATRSRSRRVAPAVVPRSSGRTRRRPGQARATSRRRSASASIEAGAPVGGARHLGRRARRPAGVPRRAAGARPRLLPRRAGTWEAMGVMLSAAGLAALVPRRVGARRALRPARGRGRAWPPGSEGLTFLPYLAGERTPHADPYGAGVRGAALRHDRGGLVRAVLEGVAYGLRDSLELLRGLGVDAQVGRASREAAHAAVSGSRSSPPCSGSRSS